MDRHSDCRIPLSLSDVNAYDCNVTQKNERNINFYRTMSF